MKEINDFKSDHLSKLKLWLANMHQQGENKFFEILVDGVRVVHKTDKLEEFDRYLSWMGDTSQSMRVLVYNTKNSHRSQVFEYKTEKYVEGVSDRLYPTRKPRLSEEEIDERVQAQLEEKQKKQALLDTQKQNKELTQRLSDAELYIRELEEKVEKSKEQKNGFDMGSLLTMFSGLASANPQAKESFDGLKDILKNQKMETETKQETEQPTATFKKKAPLESPIEKNTDNIEPDQEANYIFKTNGNLDEAQAMKMYQLMQFFSDNPPYIDVVFDLVSQEKSKQAA
jgi:hypothetical protein